MLRILTFLLLVFGLVGCNKQPTTEKIEADHELHIVRDGKPLVTVQPHTNRTGNGNSVTVHCPKGEEVTIHVDPNGGPSTVYIQRTKGDGSPVFFEIRPDGKTINRSEHPLGTLPGDDGFESDANAEHAAPSDGDKPSD